MQRLVLVAVLVAIMGLAASASFAQRVCPTPPAAGTRVQITPDLTVVAVECPTGLADGRPIIERSMYRAIGTRRTVTMHLRPYPPRAMGEIAFTLENGNGNYDNNASLDVMVRGPEGKSSVDLKRIAPGRYCGHADFVPGWNRVYAWVTTPYNSNLATFDFWAGDLRDKPQMVNWMCPACRMTTVSLSCPVCDGAMAQ